MSSAKSLIDAEHLLFEEECVATKSRLCCICDTPAVVKIYTCDQNGQNKKGIGEFREESGCLTRVLCNPCHAFNGQLTIGTRLNPPSPPMHAHTQAHKSAFRIQGCSPSLLAACSRGKCFRFFFQRRGP